MLQRWTFVGMAAALAVIGCGCGGGGGEKLEPDAEVYDPYVRLASEPQRPGDSGKGWRALTHEGYVNCGVPWSLWELGGGPTPEKDKLPDREGRNAGLPYYMTAYTAKSGVELVTTNCLICHMGELPGSGELVMGLGAHNRDYAILDTIKQQADLAKNFVTDPKERAEIDKFASRMTAIAPYTRTRTIGTNPADNLAAVLFAHRDPVSLAWSEQPLLPLPPEIVVPVDPPPWWRMKKKNTLFYNAAGRGDHARIIMTASTLCLDTVEGAQGYDLYFPDLLAYLRSLEPPAYPFPVDAPLAEQGRVIFNDVCAECHGTYGANPTYPNILVPIELIETDNTLSLGASQFADVYLDWFARSYFGQIARLQPERGYTAPPLDGVWATAPYLHNGSVPTMTQLLDSPTRPVFWTRTFSSTDYDEATLGWRHTVLDKGHADEPNEQNRKRIYDTTQLGYGNGGHTFADGLSPEQRRALIEYLKTI